MLTKLSLGTAQFGLNYGIANKKGRMPKAEALKILEFAYSHGIDMVDTAYAYGESEEIIGEFIEESNEGFDIVSKTPVLNNTNIVKLDECFQVTLRKLRQTDIYAYLVHNFNALLIFKDNLWNRIEFLKRQKLVRKIGLSLYKRDELDYLLNSNLSFDIIQVPYNIFDQRFEKYFPGLNEKNVEIHARSVFLQGLFFLNQDEIDKNFGQAKEGIAKLYAISRDYRIPLNSLCLCFVLLNPYIDKAIIGVDSLEQLKKNLDALAYIDKVKDIYKLLRSLEFSNEDVILPFNWKR